MPYIFSAFCVVVCIIALYLGFKIYKDSQRIRKKNEDEESRMRF